ncbi:MAG: O-antigen ligase family protein [bacterium]
MSELFLGVFALLPLIIDASAIRPFETPKIQLFEIAVVFFAAAVLISRFHSRLRSGKCPSGTVPGGHLPGVDVSTLDLCVLGSFAILALASAFSISPGLSFFGSEERVLGLVFYLAVTAMYFCIRIDANSEGLRKYFFASLAVSVIVAVYGIAQWFGFDVAGLQNSFPVYGTYGAERAFGTIGHPNLFAAYLAMILPFALLLPRFWMRTLFVFILSFAILASYSRAAWIAAGLGMMASVSCLYPVLARKWLPRFAGIAAVLITVIFLNGPSLLNSSNSFLFRLGTLTDFQNGSARARLEEWKFGATKLLERPILGYGPETYALISYTRVKNPHEAARGAPGPDPSIADRLHNLELDTLWNSGILGLVALLMTLWFAFRELRVWLKSGKNRVEAAAVMGSLVAYLVANQAGFDFSVTAILFSLLLARIAFAEEEKPEF